MGTRRLATIEAANPLGLSVPLTRDWGGEGDPVWKKILREAARVKQSSRCLHCREPLTRLTATADHRTPRRHGGLTVVDNIAAVCSPCNTAKGCTTEKKFKALLRHPPATASINLLLAHARYRIWTREELAQKRILAFVGIETGSTPCRS